MSYSQQTLHEIAIRLFEAEQRCSPIASLSAAYPELQEAHAYAIQNINATRAMREGKRCVGYKVGLTSKEAQRQFKVFRPDFGHLFDTMAVPSDGVVDLTKLIQPKIEGEIAFVMGRELKGPGVTLADAARAVDSVLNCLEIVDSRIEAWKITAVDTIADNGSSALFVLGGVRRKLEGLDLTSIGMALSQNGEVQVTGAGAAVLGNPLEAVVFLANELGRHDKALMPGEIVLSGALSSMLAIRAGDHFSGEMLGLGRVGVRFRGGKG